MEQYNVTGMSCAACVSRVEKAVNQVPGVESCSVSLLTNSMGVEGSASSDSIIKAVTDAGYGASLKGAANDHSTNSSMDEEALKDRETPVLKKRLVTSLGFLIVLMYFSMGHMMWGWPLPAWFEGNHVAMGLVQLLLSAIIMIINQKFFVNGFKSLFKRSPNMDTLVALGSMSSFVWSVYALFMMTDAVVKGNADGVMMYMDEFYFESAAMILTLITVGKMLEARSKGKTTDALKSLMKLAPKTAVLYKDGKETEVSIDQVKKGDVFVVRPGENIPVDGIVLEGVSAVNEAALTGESIPVDKTTGDLVSAATLNQSGYLKCEASRVGEDTTLSQIIKMVSDAAATKAPIAKIADRVSGVFVPVVISIAVITTIIWLLLGQDFAFENVRKATEEIGALKPSFMSVTYGAGGGVSNYTLDIAKNLMEKHNVPMLAHLTCVSSSKELVASRIEAMKEAGIENVMALRGDLTPELMESDRSDWDYHYAVELVRQLKETEPSFCIGAACYPEVHPESANQKEDIKHLKEKVDAGADFLTTQMVFDNNLFFNFMYKLREAGVTVPVVPGIMPITNAKQVERAIKLSGSFMPQRFKALVDKFGSDPEAMKQAGIIYASDQIIDLYANGITNVHVYSMNKPEVAKGIQDNVSAILGKDFA